MTASDVRDTILREFSLLVTVTGERAATLEATARAAGVSKGGLLYHFGSKSALVDGVIARLEELVDADCAAIEHSPEGPVHAYITTSADLGSDLDVMLDAALRLFQSGDHPRAGAAIDSALRKWHEVLTRTLQNSTHALLVQLVGDGLYYRSTTSLGESGVANPEPEELLAIVQVLNEITRTKRRGRTGATSKDLDPKDRQS
ncbi:TetR/AcrR family transcriptional regulator [Humidisolicoccus flavus]|uniref:TetR/AcrR family transcriptional regulator n=1 Tax=Humidisolicoccus flavus TaxID=3111414 RepID=UPI003245AB03